MFWTSELKGLGALKDINISQTWRQVITIFFLSLLFVLKKLGSRTNWTLQWRLGGGKGFAHKSEGGEGTEALQFTRTFLLFQV